MTWFWSPCLREPETERYKLCQDNRVWGRGASHSRGKSFGGHGLGNILVGNILDCQSVQADVRQGRTTASTGQAEVQFTGIGNHFWKKTTWKILHRPYLSFAAKGRQANLFKNIKVVFCGTKWLDTNFVISRKLQILFAIAPRRINRNWCKLSIEGVFTVVRVSPVRLKAPSLYLN